jgi:hypothetical protein
VISAEALVELAGREMVSQTDRFIHKTDKEKARWRKVIRATSWSS